MIDDLEKLKAKREKLLNLERKIMDDLDTVREELRILRPLIRDAALDEYGLVYDERVMVIPEFLALAHIAKFNVDFPHIRYCLDDILRIDYVFGESNIGLRSRKCALTGGIPAGIVVKMREAYIESQ